MVHVEPSVSMRELAVHLPELVLTCERLGVSEPDQVAGPDEGRQAFQWLESAAVRLHGFLESNRPGAIDVLPGGSGGAVFEHLDELPSWLAARLNGDDIDAKVKKLCSTGRAQLHLFIRVHDTAMPFSLYYPLAWGDAVPTEPLHPPGELAGVWLAPAWSNPILWWSAKSGWSRADCLD